MRCTSSAFSARLAACLLAPLSFGLQLAGQTLAPEFTAFYSVRDLGAPAGVERFSGPIVFQRNDPSTLLVGATAADSEIYAVKLERDAQGHISGLSSGATLVAHASGNPADPDAYGLYAGMDFGPGGVLFYATWDMGIGQIKPGGSDLTRYIPLSDFQLDSRVGGLGFVPDGVPGAGRLKFLSSGWTDASVTPDGSGTYNIAVSGQGMYVPIAYGFVYAKSGRPGFARFSVLIDYLDETIEAYEVDANGDPIPATERLFLSDFGDPNGAIIDPLTGDFVFSSSNADKPRIIVVGAMSGGIPQIVITAPIDGTILRGPATFQVEAEAKEEGGVIASVEFLQNGLSIGKVGAPQAFGVQTDSLPAGQYSFTAVAYDGTGHSSTSQVVRVTVVNDAPIVSLLFPTNNTTFAACSDLYLGAQVQMGNSDIASAEILMDNTVQRRFTQVNLDVPLSARIIHLEEGVHEFTVQVTDRNGLIATARATNVVVQPLELHRLAIHHYQPAELRFCFKGLPGSTYVWEQSGSVPFAWRSFLTNTAPADTLRLTNTFDQKLPPGFFRTRKLD
jgi:Bacterial Ig domain